MKRMALPILPAVIVLVVITPICAQTGKTRPTAKVSSTAQECLECHRDSTPGIVAQWRASAHARASVDCFSCHDAAPADLAAFDHNGRRIVVIVTPSYCARCHKKEAAEFESSHHSKAAQFIGSLDNMLGEVVEGGPAAANGCRQCHGSEVRSLGSGKFDPATWPNSGIGRVNPDGSRGSCAACHGRHAFSSAQARQPENCGKCHMGPDHPQAEIYAESKHGIQFRANIAQMRLTSRSWVVGKDYSAAPTCSTCHMGATSTQKVTHDIGERISFTLRPAVSIKLENWQKRRSAMQDVCSNCHASGWVENFYKQYEGTIDLYNEKFAKPSKTIMDNLYAASRLTRTPFDEKIEWVYYELWHHEGRRARMGTAMMGPDFTQWHGFYEVAKHFYDEFVPEAELLLPGVTTDLLKNDYHRWKQGLTKEQIQEQLEFYRKRYEQLPQ